jgi:hypothetical protein
MTEMKYYGEIGKPTPKAEVMRYLKAKRYVDDAKDFAGEECDAVVVVAKGQGELSFLAYRCLLNKLLAITNNVLLNMPRSCRCARDGTRVDYILASPNSPYRFRPGLLRRGLVQRDVGSSHRQGGYHYWRCGQPGSEAEGGEDEQRLIVKRDLGGYITALLLACSCEGFSCQHRDRSPYSIIVCHSLSYINKPPFFLLHQYIVQWKRQISMGTKP